MTVCNKHIIEAHVFLSSNIKMNFLSLNTPFLASVPELESYIYIYIYKFWCKLKKNIFLEVKINVVVIYKGKNDEKKEDTKLDYSICNS